MIVTFIGHSVLPADHDLYHKLRKLILELVQKEEKISFYCGGYGEFDALCVKVCRELKPELPCSETVYVTPYLKENERMRWYMDGGQYDTVIYPPLERVPYKYAIVKRNQWMVDRADLIFSYVTVSWGGAAGTLTYAKRQKKRIVDLARSN